MAQVLITGIVALFLLQLAAGQSAACQNALNTFQSNLPNCEPGLTGNPLIICTGPCRGYYDDVIENCDATFGAAVQQALDSTCQGNTGNPGTITSACQNALNTFENNIPNCEPELTGNPLVICSGQCRGYYDDVIENCNATFGAAVQQALDSTCQGNTGNPGTITPACQNALNTFDSNIPNCEPELTGNPLIICTGPCRGYYDDVIENCDATFGAAAAAQQALDSTCQGDTGNPGTTTSACQNALNTLTTNNARCTPTQENPRLFCTGECRGYYDAVVDNCDPTSARTAQQALDTTCQGTTGGNGGSDGDSNGGVSIFKGLGMFSLLLISVIAAVAF